MELIEPLLSLMKWAAERGLLSAGEAIGILVFIYLQWNSSYAFQKGLEAMERSQAKTINAQRSQIDMQENHIERCEERYSLLRQDVNQLQSYMNEHQQSMLKAMLNERGHS